MSVQQPANLPGLDNLAFGAVEDAPNQGVEAMRKVLSVLIFFMLPSCGGGTPAPESPDEETTEQSSDDESDMADDESGDAADDEESAADESESDSSSDEKSSSGASSGSAKKLLTQEGTTFIHSFAKSEAGEKAEANCEKSSGGDAEKKAKCLAKVIPKTTSGIRFEKGPEGDWWFIRFEVKNKKPIDYNRIKAEFGEDTGGKITIKTSGRDKGRGGKGAVPSEFEIEVPDDYTVIIQEPGRGKTVYETKLGLFDES